MSGERITLQLYMGEIVSLICEGIMSSSWASKRKSALAISKLSQVLGSSLSLYHDALLKSLMKEIPGRLWEGKDALLYALADLCTSCHEAISSRDPSTPNAILSMTTSACSKKVKKYREAAFCCLEQVIKAFKIPDFFNMVFPFLFETCNSNALILSAQVPMASDAIKAGLVAGPTITLLYAGGDEEEHNSVPHAKIVDCITSCISVGNVRDILEHKKNLVNVILVFLSPGIPWIVKMQAFLLIKELCSRLHNIANDSQEISLHAAVTSFVHELFHSASPKIVECMYAIKIAQVHIAASECLLEMTELYRALPPIPWNEVGFKSELLNQYNGEKNEQAKSFLKKSIDILESLQQKGEI
ncbi:ARM repeat superfamily protein [Actinidia rufa]|uniref:ARM repeat superfamily protein n=1 Tax=Actinidia rufa TaxID=165716 RepID=A0A7J0H5P8_9ERIC|nr:ARM repeat superfamily protein [Actinidia rufa]